MAKNEKEKNTYKECWSYLKESRNYFLIITAVFLISGFIGFLYPVFLIEFIKKFVEEILTKTEGMSFIQLFIFILENNLMTAFVGLLFGVFFGLFPLLLAFLNGYIIGFVANFSVASAGIFSLWKLLPHGIFELPALIISLGLGLKLGMFIFAKNKKKRFLYDLKNSLRVFVFVIIPLLIIAGIIEAGLIILMS